MKRSIAAKCLVLSACVPILLHSAAAFAAEGTLEDVVVTAQKREQKLQDVGVSVTALSSDDVRALGLFDAKDIQKAVPGVVFASTAGGAIASNLTIRGVSQSDFSANQESPNSIYIDEVYLSSPNAAAFTMYDTDRVEVLRGPQGTLFGRASSGGLVGFFTKRPTKEFEGYTEVGFGDYQSKYIEAAAGGPFSDTVRGRISTRLEEANGWFKNTAPGGKATFENRFFGIRGQLEADLTDSLTARLSLSFDQTPRERAGMYVAHNAYYVNGHPAPLPANVDAYGTGPGNDLTGYRNTSGDVLTAAFNNVGFFKDQKISPTLYLDWKAGSAKVTSITNFTKFSNQYNEDCDAGPTNYCNFPIAQDLKQWSEELRAFGESGPLTWTTGVYVLDVKQFVLNAFSFPSLTGTDFAWSDVNNMHQDLRSYSAFGQLEYKLTPKITGTFGLRYTHDRKSFDSKVLFYELGNGYSGGTGSTVYNPPLVTYDFSSETVGGLATKSAGMVSGKIQLDYRPVDDTLLYASISRGVKGPGFNTNVSAALTNAATPFGDEFLYAYELGSKLEFLDHRVRLNTGVYYYDYHNVQEFAYNGLQGIVSNYQGNFRGLEVELTAVPAEKLTISLGASLMGTTIKNVPTVYSGVQTENSVNAPKRMFNGYVRKTFTVGQGELGAQWSFDYISDVYSAVENDWATLCPGSFMHNARITYELPKSGIEFAAFVNNISDVRRQNFSFDLIVTTGSTISSYAKPRWWGLSMRKKF